MGKRLHTFVKRLRREWQITRQKGSWVINIALVAALLLGVPLLLADISLLLGVRFLELINILAVPITIGAAVPLINWLQKKRELDVEHQSARDRALQAYLGAMSELMIKHRLRTPKPDEGVRTAVRSPDEGIEPSVEDVRGGTGADFNSADSVGRGT